MKSKKTTTNVTALHSLPSSPVSAYPSSAQSSSTPSTSIAVSAAEDDAAAAEGAVHVAEARLREAEDVAPTIGPRLAAAEDAVAAARTAAQRQSQTVAARARKVEDAEGALEAAQAVVDDLTADGAPAKPATVVAARVRAEKAARAVETARAGEVDAEEARALAEAQLTAAEAHLSEVRREPIHEASSVIAARAALDSARRAHRRAEEVLAAARLEAERGADRPGAPVVTEFASLDAFVEDYLLPNWRHRPSQGHWCATWWQHSEAIARLEAVWEAFEVMRREPAPAMSTWWRDHLEVHMRSLIAEDGTFAGCTASRHETVHQQQETWPMDPPENGQFHTDPESPRQPRRVTLARSEGA